jgi:GNAT superfamily N-acetyltransferase
MFGVYSMWVAPEVRRRGVALALLSAVEDWIRSAGGREAQLSVVESVVPARELYARAGYVPDGRREPAEEPGMSELGMRKAL